MSARKGGLNKGLDAIIPKINVKPPKSSENEKDTAKISEDKGKTGTPNPAQSSGATAEEPLSGELVQTLRVSKIEPNRKQPRKRFDEEKIEELAASIREHGVIQPLLVQKAGDHFEIVAGERRWRAAQKAGLKELPVIIKEYSPQRLVEISLIENIQREDLNPIEEAEAYEQLMKEFELTQEQLAERISKNRASVANTLRLLRLPAELRKMLRGGALSEGCGRALLGLPSEEMQITLAERAVKEKMTVREVEKEVQRLTKPWIKRVRKRDTAREAQLQTLSDSLQNRLGTRVTIAEKAKNKGKFEIEFYSEEEFERLYQLLSSAGGNGGV